MVGWWIVLFLLFIFFLFAIPVWPYSLAWGYWPSGILAILFVVLLVWLLATPTRRPMP